MSNILRGVLNKISNLGGFHQLTPTFRMYWVESNSNIDNLLAQENVSLVAILNEDDVLQECIANNQGLINFLIDDNRMTEMLQLLTSEPTLGRNESECYKYANVISELFTYKDNIFIHLIAENTKYLSILWSFVAKSKSKDIDMNKTEPKVDEDDKVINKESNESTCDENQDKATEPINDNDNINSNNNNDNENNNDENVNDINNVNISFEDESKELNPLLASFFAKVMNFLFQNKLNEVLNFLSSLQQPDDLVSVTIRHINTSAIMDFIYKTWEHINSNREQLENNDESQSSAPAKYDKIIIDGQLLQKLTDLFKDTQAQSKQQNAANLISDLVRTGRENLLNNSKTEVDEILKQCESTEFTRSTLANMFESKTKSSIVSALKLIQDLLVYRIQVQHMSARHQEHLSSLSDQLTKQAEESDRTDDVEALEGMPYFLKEKMPAQSTETFITPQFNSPVGSYGEHLQRCIRNVCIALHERLDDFVQLLLEPIGPIRPIATTMGVLQQPLGVVRLEVIHLFVALFATADIKILEKCAELNVLKILTDLFFEYQLNNQLHKYYEQIINYVMHNYSSFQNINTKQANINQKQAPTEEVKSESPPNIESNAESANNEKILNFVKLYDISKALVIQLIDDCHLIEKILDNFSLEEVPVRSKRIHLNETFEIKKEEDDVDEEQKDNEPKTVNKVRINRPGYLGHLRLIGNILRDFASDEVLAECQSFNDSIHEQWNQFKTGKLTALNELCDVKLVEESRMTEAQEQDIFYQYQKESITGSTPPSNVELLPTDFDSNTLKEVNIEQTKIKNSLDFDFDKIWLQEQNQKLNALQKFFIENCSSSLFDDDDDDDDEEIPMGDDDAFITEKEMAKLKKEIKQDGDIERPELLNNIMQEDFSPFDSKNDPFAPTDDKTNEFEENFANFNEMKWEDGNLLVNKSDEIWMEGNETSASNVEQLFYNEVGTSALNVSKAFKEIDYNVPIDDEDFAQISSANTSSPNHDNSDTIQQTKEMQNEESESLLSVQQ